LHQLGADELSMLTKHPRVTPAYGDMLADLGNPSPQQVAKALGVSEFMARKWQRTNDAPRAVMLALFWVTSWGQQWANVDTFNDAQAQRQLAHAFRRRNLELESQITRLARIADFGCANDPAPQAVRPRPSTKPALTHRPRQNPQAEPVMSRADVQAGHLATGPA
jgi:hypothetical protein